MNDGAIGADHPDPLYALLPCYVGNDLFGDVALVHQHRIACAGDDHVRYLRDMSGSHGLHVFLPVFQDQQREQDHRHRKCDAQIQADSDPEA